MSVSEGAAPPGPEARLGFKSGQIVIEFGYDDDVDEGFREQVEQVVGAPLEDEDYDGVFDAVVFWFRDGDGDLTDDLVGCVADVEEGGFIVLLTPSRTNEGQVAPQDIQEACSTSGLTASGRLPVGADWVAQRLVGRR